MVLRTLATPVALLLLPRPGVPADEIPGEAAASATLVEPPAIAGLEPTILGTAGLEAAIAAWSATPEPEWPLLPPGSRLAPGDRGDAVLLLRARLMATGEAPAPAGDDATFYDAPLEVAVRAFQQRHGLEVDGVVGRATRAELALSPADRIAQATRTVASRRMLPADLGARFLLLNLPAFTVEAYAGGRPELALRAVVGTAARPTRPFASAVDGLIVHPVWNVPSRIAREETAPRAMRDPDFLVSQGFEVRAADGTGAPLGAGEVDWVAFARGELELALRQRPGPANALGALSLQFPNPENICLHDTPDRRLFDRSRRTASHGCIRVERAVELARWLLATQPEDTLARFEAALATAGATTWLSLAMPTPIYVVSWPVWIDTAGVVQLRPEVYPEGSGR